MLRQAATTIKLTAPRAGMVEVTRPIADWVRSQAMTEGLLTVFCRHTSASLLIQENAAPAARRDLEAYLARIAPESESYEHDEEGPDDMPAHLRSALTQTQLTIPLREGWLALGRWQGIFLFEHRHRPPPRELALHLIGG